MNERDDLFIKADRAINRLTRIRFLLRIVQSSGWRGLPAGEWKEPWGYSFTERMRRKWPSVEGVHREFQAAVCLFLKDMGCHPSPRLVSAFGVFAFGRPFRCADQQVAVALRLD